VNLNVPSQEYALPFYFQLLGCGMDPRKQPDAPIKTLWANCGASQFHLPFGDVAQRIPGHIGLIYDSLDGLKERLTHAGSCVKESQVGMENGREFVRLVDQYDNTFNCRQDTLSLRRAHDWKQPLIDKEDERADCRGLSYVEFHCPVGTAERIALFYESVFDATTSVVTDRGTKIAVIAFGNVDEEGRSDQSLSFRESTQPNPPYDGHHVAMYVGESAAEFERAFLYAQTAKVVWVNPRFSDKTIDLEGARKWKQFRFKDIVDMNTGEKIFELEHEMRSIEHESWPGPPPPS
jgi:hypothetical protein